MADGLIELSYEECLEALRGSAVGRIAVVMHEFPVVLPVNYRLVETSGRVWLAVRTRPGSELADDGARHVGFEIDQIDPARREGWSVLVRGTMHRVDTEAADFSTRFDPEPWVTEERDAWLVIDPFAVTGRRLKQPADEFDYNPAAYL